MNRVSLMLAISAALLFAVSPAVASEDLESEFAEMKELVKGLQQKIEAQEEQIEHQGELLDQAQTAVKAQQEQTESLSGLSSFLDSIDVVGHVAGSYNYNFNTPNEYPMGGADLNNGNVGALPFHSDHNTFTVDQIWLGVGKPATEESPAGFQVDFLYGNNANFLGQGTGSVADPLLVDVDLNGDGVVDFSDAQISLLNAGSLSRRANANDSTSDFYIAQAYVEYACGCIGEGSNVKFGKFQTMVGAEVVQATGNFNVTRGIVYSLLQPVDHLGLYATTDLGPVELGAAVVNSGGSSISSPDINKEKSYVATAMVGDDRMSARASFVYGAEDVGRQTSNYGLVDVTAWFNPMDSVSTWANYNYLYIEETGAYANGVALAGRVGLTDKIGAAVRSEYIRFASNASDGLMANPLSPNGTNSEIWAVTGTLDYMLTDHLTAKAEVRWDYVNQNVPNFDSFALNNPVPGGGSSGNRGSAADQTVGLLEIVYEF